MTLDSQHTPPLLALVANHVEHAVVIERTRNTLIDLDCIVDDCRRDCEAAIKRLHVAVRQRDDCAERLLRAIHAAVAA